MLRIQHTGGQTAAKGDYWNFSNGERISMDSSGVLPGGSTTTYYRAGPLMILAAGPVLGLIYAAFLPFIGLAIIAKMLFTKLFGRTLEGLSRVTTFNWSPAQSYLAGRRHKKAVKDSKAGSDMTKSDKDR